MSDPTLQVLVLERRDPALNMARFYVLSIEPTLFGDAALVRAWGRVGCRGRVRLDLYEDRVKATEALEDWLRRKSRRGYAVRPPMPEFETRSSALCKARQGRRCAPSGAEDAGGGPEKGAVARG
ncbi:WGR domain-containing protein [Methylobacterium isbiliense]|uniref:WGR domain-containing protein n=1 Tax=Methylobacterium isbiliense TaxID=315478 RepID=UPI0027958F15|nr:WGR domain-containing protein [Methylobacterium isbiliense]